MSENESWQNRYRRTMAWRIRLENRMLRSPAFKAIKYLPTLQVLLWASDRRELKKTKGRGHKKFVETGKPFSFTYAEAKFYGLAFDKFSRAIRELVVLGFWDCLKQGSGLRGDFSLYAFSDRWQKWGQPDFERQELKKRVKFGSFGSAPKRRISNAGSSELTNSGTSELPARESPS